MAATEDGEAILKELAKVMIKLRDLDAKITEIRTEVHATKNMVSSRG